MRTTTRCPIVTRALTVLGLGAATVAVAVAGASAQVPDKPPPPGGFPPGGPGPMIGLRAAAPGGLGMGTAAVSRLTLLTQPAVQKELKLTDAQKKKIGVVDEQFKKKAQEHMRTQMDQMRNQLETMRAAGGGPPDPQMLRASMEGMKQGMQAGLDEADAAALKELQPKQRARLEQVKLQVDGPLSFERPDVIERLGLAPDQIEHMQAILAEGRGQMDQAPALMFKPGPAPGQGPGVGPGQGPGPGSGPGAGGAPPSPKDMVKNFNSKEFQDQFKSAMEKRRKDVLGVRDRMMQALGQALTRGQRSAYRRMLGEPFDVKALQSGPIAPPAVSFTVGGEGNEPAAEQPKPDQPQPKDAQTQPKGKAARSRRSR
jgi:hypothetical protein